MLGAYVDQSPLWKEPHDEHVVLPYELEGAAAVVQPGAALCAHAGAPHCFGLPHVVRLVSRDGACAIDTVLGRGSQAAVVRGRPVSPASWAASAWAGRHMRSPCAVVVVVVVVAGVGGVTQVWRGCTRC